MRYQFISAGSRISVIFVMALKELLLPLMPLVEKSSNAIRYVHYNVMEIIQVSFFRNLFSGAFLTA